jgi:Phosphotransferase enzyme family
MVEGRAGSSGRANRVVIKRTSSTIDWIAAETDDVDVREARLASGRPLDRLRSSIWPYLGAGADGEMAAIVMPDLTAELLSWERPSHDRADVDVAVLERVVDRLAWLHATPWWAVLDRPHGDPPTTFPWCPLSPRLTLTSRPACARHIARGIPAGVESAGKLVAGWDAFDRQASPEARDLVEALAADPLPLIRALEQLPATGLHGDLKLANVAVGPGPDDVQFIDWQMTILAPIAVELGWFLVTNSAVLPEPPDDVLARYRTSLDWHLGRTGVEDHTMNEAHVVGNWDAQLDLGWIVGLLLRGWRKGLDTEAGATLGSGVSGADDLRMWSDRAVEAARRRL